ncbi:MFS transporter [Parabacteroides sp. Marseille-P3160]|uniref:MFS transporter n=1 Tax=Parabacteroides sp. Marseille-P3160 TaxID=1917887 RepID=UPI0009B950C3|nr:MFS transporter [Parabacteroides sp. Marseille-P3160]
MIDWKKTFVIIWSGQLLSILSSSIVGFAIVLWLSFETRSAEVLAFSTIAALLPQSLLGPIAGVYVDRWKRKRVMILSDSFIAFCTIILAALFYLDVAEIWQIYLLLAMRSIGSAFHSPAMQASIPLIAPKEELVRISGINQMIQSLCNIAGPALGALLITWMDMSFILMLDVVGAIIACLGLLLVVIPDPPKEEIQEKRQVFREMIEGIREVTQKKGLKWLFIFSILCTFFLMPVGVLFPLMTLNHFSGTAFQMSLIEVVWGSGMLIGGMALGLKKVKWNKIVLINLSYIILGLSFAFSGLLPKEGYAGFVVLTTIGGIASSIYFSMFNTVIQTNIKPSALGRVFSMFMSVSILPSMIGLLSTGFLADSIGIASTFLICGIVVTLAGVISFGVPSIMLLSKEDNER